MARAATSTELEYLRSGRQISRLKLAILKANVIYTAQLATAPVSNDGVSTLSITNESGTLASVKDGMMLGVGSSAGASDKGNARVRSIVSGTLTIGLTSDIVFAAGDYLTITDDISWWAKPAPLSGDAINVDGDIAYTNQHEDWKPMVIMHPDAVLELSGATVSISDFDASESWVPGGGTISSYAWSAPGAASITNGITATPTITYNATGTYLVGCTVTASNGESNSGYRKVYVWSETNPPVTSFKLSNISGSYDSGGWTCKVETYNGVNIADLYDGAKVILFADERYGNHAGSIGPVAGRESIKMIGWVDSASIEIGYDRSSVTFDICGPATWLAKLPAQGTDLTDDSGTPTTWATVEELTLDKALADICTWQSTAGMIIDVYPSEDTRRLPSVDGLSSGTTWSALTSLAEKIKTRPCADRYGRLFVEADQQLLETADRSTIPTVMDIERQDWREKVGFERGGTAKYSQVEVNGTYWSGSSHTAARAGYGNYPGRLGQSQSVTMIFDDEDQATAIVGHLREKLNNPYPAVYLYLAHNQGLVDVCPRQYVSMSLAAADTPMGLVWSAKRLIPRVVSLEQQGNGALVTELECEAETSGTPGVRLPIPTEEPISTEADSDYLTDVEEIMLPTGDTWFPNLVSSGDSPISDGCRDTLSAPGNGPFILWPDEFNLTTQDAEKISTLIHYPCMIRSGSAAAKTRLRIIGKLDYLYNGSWVRSISGSAWLAQAVDVNGDPVLTSINEVYPGYDDRDSNFMPSAQVDVRGFRIVLPVPETVPPALVDKTFDFTDGVQGWVWDTPSDGIGRWNDGKIEKSEGVVNWHYYPDAMYIASGAYIQADHNNWAYNASFASLGLDVVESENPLVTTYKYVNARLQSTPKYTCAAGDIGKRVRSFAWYTDESGGRWEYLDNVHIYGFTSALVARRLTIERLELYNVCGV
jgi:hypothetical protein